MIPSSQNLLAPGHIFSSRYRIERFLARGGMGEVYVAEHTATERKVALKLLFPHVLATDRARKGFELEARVANRIQSEHVVQVLDAGIDEPSGSPFIVMELLSGHDLDKEIAHRGQIPPDEVVLMLQQVASALDKAHGYHDKEGKPQPIIHRDLKPENLFLTRRESGEPCVKILDFGIAKVISQETSVSQEVRGTPLFMAPEQTGGQQVSPATDVWALGLIAFQLLSGRLYWRTAEEDGATVMGLFAEVLTMPLDSPTLRLQERGVSVPWPATFDRWFARCVNRDPAARFSSAGEAVRELAQILRGTRPAQPLPPSPQPLSAAAPRPAPQTVPGVSKATMPSGKGTDAAPGSVLAIDSFRPDAQPAVQVLATTASPAPPGPRGNAVAIGGLAVLALVGVGTSVFLATRSPAAVASPPELPAGLSVSAPPPPPPTATESASATPQPTAPASTGRLPGKAVPPVPGTKPPAGSTATATAPATTTAKPAETTKPPPTATIDHYGGR